MAASERNRWLQPRSFDEDFEAVVTASPLVQLRHGSVRPGYRQNVNTFLSATARVLPGGMSSSACNRQNFASSSTISRLATVASPFARQANEVGSDPDESVASIFKHLKDTSLDESSREHDLSLASERNLSFEGNKENNLRRNFGGQKIAETSHEYGKSVSIISSKRNPGPRSDVGYQRHSTHTSGIPVTSGQMLGGVRDQSEWQGHTSVESFQESFHKHGDSAGNLTDTHPLIEDTTLEVSVEDGEDSVMEGESVTSPPVSLYLWIIKAVPGTQHICVEGKKSPSDLEFWHSGIIKRRLTPRLVLTENGSIYRLEGPIETEDALAEGFSSDVVEQFSAGFQENWREIIEEHFTEKHDKTWTAREQQAVDLDSDNEITLMEIDGEEAVEDRVHQDACHTLNQSELDQSDRHQAVGNQSTGNETDNSQSLEDQSDISSTDIHEPGHVNISRGKSCQSAEHTSYSQPKAKLKVKDNSNHKVKQKKKDVGSKSSVQKGVLGKNHCNSYILKNWIIKPHSAGKGIYVVGYIQNGELWHSSAIESRVTSKKVKSCSGSVYVLVGHLDKLAALDEGIPKPVIDAFKKGFPKEWQEVVQENFTSQTGGTNTSAATAGLDFASPHKQTARLSENKWIPKTRSDKQEAMRFLSDSKKKGCRVLSATGQVVDLENLERSRRGRIIKPVLNYWVGQRLSLDASGGLQVTGMTEYGSQYMDDYTDFVLNPVKMRKSSSKSRNVSLSSNNSGTSKLLSSTDTQRSRAKGKVVSDTQAKLSHASFKVERKKPVKLKSMTTETKNKVCPVKKSAKVSPSRQQTVKNSPSLEQEVGKVLDHARQKRLEKKKADLHPSYMYMRDKGSLEVRVRVSPIDIGDKVYDIEDESDSDSKSTKQRRSKVQTPISLEKSKCEGGPSHNKGKIGENKQGASISDVAGERNKQLAKDKNKQLSKDKNKQLSEDKNKQLSEDKNKHLSEDKNKQLAKDKNKQLSKDKNKQLAGDRNKQLAGDRNKQLHVTGDRNKQLSGEKRLYRDNETEAVEKHELGRHRLPRSCKQRMKSRQLYVIPDEDESDGEVATEPCLKRKSPRLLEHTKRQVSPRQRELQQTQASTQFKPEAKASSQDACLELSMDEENAALYSKTMSPVKSANQQDVARPVRRQSVKEGQNSFCGTDQTTAPGGTDQTKAPGRGNTKRQPVKEKLAVLAVTAGRGTLKRKQQLKDIFEHHDNNYNQDDIFDSTPLRTRRQTKLASLDDENEDAIFEELARKQGKSRFETPVSTEPFYPRMRGFRSDTKIPASSISDDMLDKREDERHVNRVINKCLERRRRKRCKGVTPVSKKTQASQDPDTPHKRLFDEILKGQDKNRNRLDSEEDSDYYWSEAENELSTTDVT